MGSKALWTAAVGGGALTLGLLGACSGATTGNAAATTQPTFTPVSANSAAAAPSASSTAPQADGTAAISRCHTGDLSARLGTVTDGDTVHLIYTNKSGHTCTMDGYGGVDLHGPADPNGPVFSLRRDPDVQGRDADKLPKPSLVTLAPGGTAHTVITFGRYSPGDIGSQGSTKWVPTQIVSTPPDETTSLTTPWLPDTPVVRDDGATISRSYLSPIESGS